MDKKVLPLIVVSIFLVVGGGVFFFTGKEKQGKYEVSKGYEVPKEETKENFYKIRGIGFKNEAWAEYKMEGYGIRFIGEKKEEKIGKILVKLISLPIKGKEYYGVEVEGKEDSLFEDTYFALLFEKEGQKNYYLMKMKKAPIICMSGDFLGYEDISEYFDKKSIEKEYQVDLSTWNFVSEEEMTLESGKKIKVFKFRAEMGTLGSRDLWLSPDIPTYLVLNRETIEGKSLSIALTDFGMDGGLSNFKNEDLKACESESSSFPGLPPQIAKFSCQTDEDCACGVDKETGQCAFGNKNFIDTSRQCPDFCTGIAGHIKIKCINNLCTAEIRR